MNINPYYYGQCLKCKNKNKFKKLKQLIYCYTQFLIFKLVRMPIFNIKLLSLNELLFILIIKRKIKLKGKLEMILQFLSQMSTFRFSVIVYSLLFQKNKTKINILSSNIPITFHDQSYFQALQTFNTQCVTNMNNTNIANTHWLCKCGEFYM